MEAHSLLFVCCCALFWPDGGFIVFLKILHCMTSCKFPRILGKVARGRGNHVVPYFRLMHLHLVLCGIDNLT